METSFDLAVEKMRKYCLYSDRCHQDVRSKLIKDKVYGEELEQVMAILIEENFLNEERFAKAFLVGKFRQNKWGKKKIEMQLKAKQISPYCIRKGLEEIEDEEYIEVLERLWNKKFQTLRDADGYIKNQKVTKYLLGKGYGYEDVKRVISNPSL
jgi:regulatory protein